MCVYTAGDTRADIWRARLGELDFLLSPDDAEIGAGFSPFPTACFAAHQPSAAAVSEFKGSIYIEFNETNRRV
jgi:hypothetical protein